MKQLKVYAIDGIVPVVVSLMVMPVVVMPVMTIPIVHMLHLFRCVSEKYDMSAYVCTHDIHAYVCAYNSHASYAARLKIHIHTLYSYTHANIHIYICHVHVCMCIVVPQSVCAPGIPHSSCPGVNICLFVCMCVYA